MVDLPHPDDLSRFDSFTILKTTYKTVDSHGIKVYVIYPKNLKSPSSGSPLILRFHGGGFITGSSLYPGFFPRHLLEYAQQHSAIIVSPDYRLLPESRLSDTLADIESSWQWVQHDLSKYLIQETSGTITPDTNRIITAGDSAGGTLSVQLGLSHPDQIRAVTASYPALDLKSRWFNEKFEKQLFDFPQLDFDQLLEAHKAKMQATNTTIRSEDPTLETVLIMAAGIQHGVLAKLYFDLDDASQFPFERLERGDKFPKGGVVIWHGTKDSVVPIEGTRKLKELVAKKYPEVKLTVVEREGDHGFDTELSLEEAGIKEVMGEVAKVWLA